MKILFLSRWFPFPADNGSKLRIWNLLQGLGRTHEVTLLSFIDASKTPDLSALNKICREVHTHPWREYDPGSRHAKLGLFSSWPRSHVDTYSTEMEQRVRQVLAENNFDLIIASQSQMASYSKCFDKKAALLEEVELGVFRDQYIQARSLPDRIHYGLTWAKHRYYLSRALRAFHACTVVSKQELAILSESVPEFENVAVIPNCIDLTRYQNLNCEPRANSLVFTGSFLYQPNYDAMAWFVKDILPKIQAEIPDVHLTVTGDPGNYLLPPTPGVSQTGFVPDVQPYVASTWASIVPLRSGGGTRLKILEAMAMRTPVITTSKGAEGIDLTHNYSALIADTADDFAAAVVRLFSDVSLRERLVENAFEMVREKYDWASVMPLFLQLVDSTAFNGRKQ
jgi:polysaccharide biosynthesis protein PslH